MALAAGPLLPGIPSSVLQGPPRSGPPGGLLQPEAGAGAGAASALVAHIRGARGSSCGLQPRDPLGARPLKHRSRSRKEGETGPGTACLRDVPGTQVTYLSAPADR